MLYHAAEDHTLNIQMLESKVGFWGSAALYTEAVTHSVVGIFRENVRWKQEAVTYRTHTRNNGGARITAADNGMAWLQGKTQNRTVLFLNIRHLAPFFICTAWPNY
jgi:hypothetical protein